jgi:hypothetical protein
MGIIAPSSSFFEGLSQTPKLTLKEKMLRSSIKDDSFLATKQTSLQQKIDRKNQ